MGKREWTPLCYMGRYPWVCRTSRMVLFRIRSLSLSLSSLFILSLKWNFLIFNSSPRKKEVINKNINTTAVGRVACSCLQWLLDSVWHGSQPQIEPQPHLTVTEPALMGLSGLSDNSAGSVFAFVCVDADPTSILNILKKIKIIIIFLL